MAISPHAYAHVRLTVTDIDASRKFYDDVLGLPIAFEMPVDADDAASHLNGLGVAYEGVKDIGDGYILEFRDPDHIALELFAPAD